MPLGLNDEAFRRALLVGGLNVLGSGAQGANLGQSLSGGLIQGLQAGSSFQRQQKLDKEQEAKDKLAAQTEQLRQQALQQQMAQQQHAQDVQVQQEDLAKKQGIWTRQALNNPNLSGEDFARKMSDIQRDPSYLMNYQKNQAAGQVELAKAGLQAQSKQESFQQQAKLQAQRLQAQKDMQKQEQDFKLKQTQQALQDKIKFAATQPEKLNAQQEKDRFLYSQALPGLQQVFKSIQSGFDPTSLTSLPGKLAGPLLQSEAAQNFYTGGENFVKAYLYKVSGAQAGEEETKSAFKALMPQVGESKNVVNKKLHTLQGILQSLGESGKIPKVPILDKVIDQAKQGGANMATQGASGTLSGADQSEYERLRKAAGY